MDISLTSQAIRRLQAVKGSWGTVAEATGVSYSWLCKFAQGRIPNPSVRRIEHILWYFNQLDTQVIRRHVQKRRQSPTSSLLPQSWPTHEESPNE